METVWPGREDAVVDGPAALPLVRAAAALRWSRPDLTATLAELAVESAPDAGTWVAAAGWLLHGRAALGDGRDTACALLDGLARWGDSAVELMVGPQGRRLRVELAGPARRIGEAAVARALLASTTGADDADLELRADVLTEFARCAVDDAPDTVDDALSAAEEAWREVGSAPGAASVTLLRAAQSRRAGRADVAVTEAVAGLAMVDVRGRRAGATASDHVAAALTAEWIAALVDGDRLDEARGEGLAVANRLVAAARTSRQVAGLRLAIARITAVEEGPDAVLAALEPAAQAAAASDVPELESACRSMLGELHETAGRLDAALAALRAALSADRRDRERAAQLRTRLAAAAATWADRPSTDPGSSASGQPERAPGAGAHASVPVVASSGTGRRARRLAAEALEQPVGGGGDLGDGGVPDESRRSGRSAVPATAGGRVAETGPPATTGRVSRGEGSTSGTFAVPGTPSVSAASVSAASAPGAGPAAPSVPGTGPAWAAAPAAEAVRAVYRAAGGGGSLIGDALLRELTEGGRTTADPVLPPSERGAVVAARDSSGRSGTGGENAADDPLFGPLNADGSRRPDRPRPPDAGRDGRERYSGGRAGSGAAIDSHTARGHGSAGRSSLLDDTVVFDVRGDGRSDPSARRIRVDGRGPVPADGPDAPRPADGGTRAGGRSAGGPVDGPRPHDTHSARSHGAGNGTVPAVHPPAAHPPAAHPSPITREANGAHADSPYRNGAQNGALQNGADQNGARQNGARQNGAHRNGGHRNGGHRNGGHRNGVDRDGMHGDGARREGGHGPADHRNGAADRPPRDGEPAGDPASTDVPTRADGAEGSRPARRGPSRRGPGRPPSTDTDGLGLADLLAGALAEYRNL